MIVEKGSEPRNLKHRIEDSRKIFPNPIFIVLLLTTGCASPRTHLVMSDEAGLNELQEAIGTSTVTIYSTGGIYRDVEIMSFSTDSITFFRKRGLGVAFIGTMPVDPVYKIVDEQSGWGIVLGALGGAIGGGMIGFAIGAGTSGSSGGGSIGPDFGWLDDATEGAVLGGGIGLIAGGAIGNTLDQDDVYTLEDPKK